MAVEKTVKEGSPPCGLYLVLPHDIAERDFLKDLKQLFLAINSSAYEKNSHVIEYRPAEDETLLEPEALKALCEYTQSQGLIFVCAYDIERAKSCGADGVLVENIADIQSARAVLGDEAIIGMRCGLSRLKAEHALNEGADYVSFFDPTGNFVNPSLIEWWRRKADAPCLIEGRFTNDDCGFYVAAGAEFIDASAYIWNHPEGIMKGVVNMAYAIDLALDDIHQGKQAGLSS